MKIQGTGKFLAKTPSNTSALICTFKLSAPRTVDHGDLAPQTSPRAAVARARPQEAEHARRNTATTARHTS